MYQEALRPLTPLQSGKLSTIYMYMYAQCITEHVNEKRGRWIPSGQVGLISEICHAVGTVRTMSAACERGAAGSRDSCNVEGGVRHPGSKFMIGPGLIEIGKVLFLTCTNLSELQPIPELPKE